MPINCEEDIKIMTKWFADCIVWLDGDKLEESIVQAKSIGDSALTKMSLGESPLMFFVEWLEGVENTHYFLADYNKDVDELFDAMHKVLIKKPRLLPNIHKQTQCVL